MYIPYSNNTKCIYMNTYKHVLYITKVTISCLNTRLVNIDFMWVSTLPNHTATITYTIITIEGRGDWRERREGERGGRQREGDLTDVIYICIRKHKTSCTQIYVDSLIW